MEHQQSAAHGTPEQPEHMHTANFAGGKPRRSVKRWVVIGVVVAVVAAATVSAYLLLKGKNTAQKGGIATQQQPKERSKTPTMSESQASTLKTYKSTKLNIEFSYRTDWTLRETADKAEVILTSPAVTYAKKDGSSTEGVFTLKLRNGILPEAMKPTIAAAVAVKDSEVIAYSSPTDQQRQYTNLSFGGNGGTMNFVMVTGSVAFKAGEAFGSNIDTQGSVYMFAGGYGTDSNDALAFDAVPKESFNSTVYQQAVKIIESLKVY